MRSPSSPGHRLRAPWIWSVLSVLAPVGMLAICGLMLLDLRKDAWDKATQTSHNLIQVIERDITRNIEIIDLSLRGVVDNLSAPGLSEISPDLRQLVLFDRASTATDMGLLLVLDENGDTLFESVSVPARKLNNADRDYFQAHAKRADLGLFISRPVLSRLLGVPVIVLSRRITKPDGRFGGIVSASVKLSYFSKLFENIGLGTRGAINLYLRDGTRLVRHSRDAVDIGADLSGTETFQRYLRTGSGVFVANSARDGEARLYTHADVGASADAGVPPLILSVSLAVSEIEAEWRAKTLVIGLMVLLLCGFTIGLSLLFGRELRHRTLMQAELARLSLTDTLTGLPNRRRFEEEIAGVGRSAAPFVGQAMLVIDADHFKDVNDRYGHVIGDEVLKGLARCLAASVQRPGDLVCRIGGEEFAMLLRDTDEAGAHRIAERVHAEVRRLGIPAARIAPGSITVSIGVAGIKFREGGTVGPADLYRIADAALYEAKTGGRNRTCPPPARTHAQPERSTSGSWVGAV